MSSYFMSLSNAPVSFKVKLQGLTAQPTMKAELVAAALAIKEAAFGSIIMKEVGESDLRTARESSTLLCGTFLSQN